MQAKTVTQNTVYYTLALVFQKVVAFVYFMLLARTLSVDDLGKYTFAFSFTTIFSVLVDVGLSSVLTREIAKQKENNQKLVANIFTLKVILSGVIYLLIVALVNILNYPEITKILVYVAGLVMLLDNFSLTWWATLRGKQNLKYESLSISIFEIIILGVGCLFLYLKFNVVLLAGVILLGSLFNAIFGLIQMIKRAGLKPKIEIDKPIIFHLLKISWPFALSGIFARLNTQIDTVFLSKIGCATNLMCEENNGIYAVATKITLALHFIPLAFSAAVYPAMANQFSLDKDKLKKTFEKSMRYLMLVGLPVATIIAVLAPDFVPLVFGKEFTNSVLALQILMISLALIFLTFPIGAFLNATSRQLRNTFNIGVAVMVNIVLNLILIPKYTYNGAALASTVSSLIILILGLVSVNKVIKYDKKYLLISFVKMILSAGIMWFVLQQLLFKVNFIVLAVLGALIYAGILFLVRGIKKSDLTDILISLKVIK